MSSCGWRMGLCPGDSLLSKTKHTSGARTWSKVLLKQKFRGGTQSPASAGRGGGIALLLWAGVSM